MNEPAPIEQAPSHSGRSRFWLERVRNRLSWVSIRPSWHRRFKSVFHFLLQIRTGGRGLVCRLPSGETLRILPEFRYIAWNLAEYSAFRDCVKSGMIALDIGANVGAYAMLFAQWAGPQGRVYAFEPVPETFAALQRHIKLNRLESRITAVPTAIGETNGQVMMTDFHAAGSNRVITNSEQSATKGRLVPCLAIDEFCDRERLTPDFIKIDVEGYEIAVLRGGRRTIERCRGHLQLFVELHPTTWEQIGVQKSDWLAELGVQRLRMECLPPANDPWSIEGVCVRLVPA